MSNKSNINSYPEYLDDPGQVGNKTWRLVPKDGIKIAKSTGSNIDTYTFSAAISSDPDNVVEVKDNGLFIPKVTSKVAELTEEINDLRDKIDKLKATEYRPTESVSFYKESDSEGVDSIMARINVSMEEDNCIEIKPDGIYAQSMNSAPGSIADIERRLGILESELESINEQIDNLKSSAYINEDNIITPPDIQI